MTLPDQAFINRVCKLAQAVLLEREEWLQCWQTMQSFGQQEQRELEQFSRVALGSSGLMATAAITQDIEHLALLVEQLDPQYHPDILVKPTLWELVKGVSNMHRYFAFVEQQAPMVQQQMALLQRHKEQLWRMLAALNEQDELLQEPLKRLRMATRALQIIYRQLQSEQDAKLSRTPETAQLLSGYYLPALARQIAQLEPQLALAEQQAVNTRLLLQMYQKQKQLLDQTLQLTVTAIQTTSAAAQLLIKRPVAGWHMAAKTTEAPINSADTAIAELQHCYQRLTSNTAAALV